MGQSPPTIDHPRRPPARPQDRYGGPLKRLARRGVRLATFLEEQLVRWWGILAIGLFVGLVLRRRLDDTVAAMHLPNAASLRASGVTAWPAFSDLGARVEGVVAWRGWDAARPGWGIHDTLAAYVLVDLIVAFLTMLVLYALRGYAKHVFEPWPVTGDAQAHRGADEPVPVAHDLDPRWVEINGSLLRLAPLAALIYFLLAIVEDVLLLVVAGGPSVLRMQLLHVAAVGKLGALITAAVPPLLIAIWVQVSRIRRTRGPGERRWLDEVVALRAQVVGVVLLVAVVLIPGEMGKQVDDALLASLGRVRSALVTLLMLAALSLLVHASGRLCIAAYAHPPRGPATLRAGRLLTLAGGGVLLFALSFAPVPVPDALVAARVPGLLIVGLALVSWPFMAAPLPTADAHTPSATGLLRWLTAVPWLSVGLIALRSGVLVLVSGALWWAVLYIAYGAAGFVLGAGIIRWGLLTRVIDWEQRRPVVLTFTLTAVVFLGVGVMGVALPVAVGQVLGAWGVILAFAGCVIVGSVLLVLAGDRVAPRGVFAVAHLRRMPVLTLVVVAILATAVTDRTWRYHDVRVAAAPTGGAREATLEIEDALDGWREQMTAADAVGQQPMVFVASSGGGIRAAYWTTAVLSCLLHGSPGLEERPRDTADAASYTAASGDPVADADECGQAAIPERQHGALFAASGISGGSLGLVVARALDDDLPAYTRVLSDDFLGPTVAAFAWRDAVSIALRSPRWGDRAAVLEEAWERAFDGEVDGDLRCGFLAHAWRGAVCDPRGGTAHAGTGGLRYPLLLLHGAAADDGCRLTVSPLNLAQPFADERGPLNCYTLGSVTTSLRRPDTVVADDTILPALSGTRDIHDFTCVDDGTAGDVRLSTAALLSARFPWVSPTGALTSCSRPTHRTFVVDGGLLDSSAASPLVELWPTVARQVQEWNRQAGVCVAPRLLLIDNGYVALNAESAPARPLETTAPLRAATAAQNARAASSRQALAVAFERAFRDIDCPGGADGGIARIAHVYPLSHPGPQAPLGWTLSRFSRSDLRRELSNEHNQRQLEIVRRWFQTTDSG